MTGQHVRSSTVLLGQCSILTGHCPLTGRYFKPWTYVSVSDRWVSNGFLKRLTIGRILRCAWRALGSVTCQSWQGPFTVYSKQWKSSSNFKAFLWTKNAFREFLQGQSLLVNLSTWFSSVLFQSPQMHCRVFCNLANSSSVKTNQEIMIFTFKKQKYTHVIIQVQAFQRKPKKVRLFSRNKKAYGLVDCKTVRIFAYSSTRE